MGRHAVLFNRQSTMLAVLVILPLYTLALDLDVSGKAVVDQVS